MMSRVTLRKSDVLFWIKDSEKAKRPNWSKNSGKMINNNYDEYADFRMCITQMIKQKVYLNAIEDWFK